MDGNCQNLFPSISRRNQSVCSLVKAIVSFSISLPGAYPPVPLEIFFGTFAAKETYTIQFFASLRTPPTKVLRELELFRVPLCTELATSLFRGQRTSWEVSALGHRGRTQERNDSQSKAKSHQPPAMESILQF